MADQLELATIDRIGSARPLKRERHTFNFMVNGVSLFEATQASSSDMCGCFSDPRFEHELAHRFNFRIASMLTSDVPVRSGHRVALFAPSVAISLAERSRFVSRAMTLAYNGLTLHTRTDTMPNPSWIISAPLSSSGTRT
jgi:hypothetical protein